MGVILRTLRPVKASQGAVIVKDSYGMYVIVADIKYLFVIRQNLYQELTSIPFLTTVCYNYDAILQMKHKLSIPRQ